MTKVQPNQRTVNETEEIVDGLQAEAPRIAGLQPVLYTLAQAKRLLSISQTKTIRRYAAQGLIRILKVSAHRWFVEASEVFAFPTRLTVLRTQPKIQKPDWHQKLIDFGVLEGNSDRKSKKV